MHELAAVESIVRVALAKAREVGSPRVTGMHFVIHEGGHVSEDSVRLCFEIAAKGTPAQGADLFFAWNPPRYRCLTCGNVFDGPHSDDNTTQCVQCSESAMVVPPVPEFYLDSINVE